MYTHLFTHNANLSFNQALTNALLVAGFSEQDARNLVEKERLRLGGFEMATREQGRNGVDTMPTVLFEGPKRNFAITGASLPRHYLKAMENVESDIDWV